MPRSGGQADSVGGDYQAAFVAGLFLDLIEGKIDSVRSHPPKWADLGRDGLLPIAVDDAITEASSDRTYFQAKSQAPHAGQWTPTRLEAEGVLQQFISQLGADPRSECVLVSSSPCHLFGEVARRAKSSVSEREFMKNLSARDTRLINQVEGAMRRAGFSAYALLRRCSVKVVSHESLLRELRSRGSRLFLPGPSVEPLLLDLARKAMAEGRLLSRQSALDALAATGLTLRSEGSVEDVEAAVHAASSELRRFPKDIEGVHIPRAAVEEAMAWIRTGTFKDQPVAVFLDQAGCGKSAAMSELLGRLEADGLVVLGLRLGGQAFSSTTELASLLNLPETVPVVLETLAAAGRQVVLILDQVDALSTAMARDPRSLSVVLDLVARVASSKRVPVVLACRPFDWRFDHRLSTVRQAGFQEFHLPLLTQEEVDLVLAKIGLSTSDLHPLTRSTISSPLHLRYFVELVIAKRRDTPNWVPPQTPTWTLQWLYEELLALKERKSRSVGIPPGECTRVLGALAQKMQIGEVLAVPAASFSSDQATIDWLCSEGIVTLNELRISFTHQTLFDFVYARWFVGQGHRLSEYLRGTDQGLFYRPMARQILEYLRAAYPQAYRQELAELLAGRDIRAHLRSLTIGWLGQIPDPTREELTLLEGHLAVLDGWSQVLQRFYGNPAWLHLLGLSRVASWLEEWSGPSVDALVWYLTSVLPRRQEDVLSLLQPFLNRDSAWNGRLLFALGRLDKGWTPGSADLLRDLVRSPLTPLQHGGWWDHALHSLSKEAPDLACGVVAAILERSEITLNTEAPARADVGARADGTATIAASLPPAHGLRSAIGNVAEREPLAFLERLAPFALSILERGCRSTNSGFFRASVTMWDLDPRNPESTEEHLLAGLRSAAIGLADSNPPAFRAVADSLASHDLAIVQKIVAEAFLKRPTEYAPDAAAFLCSDHRRLRLGKDGSPTWLSAQLLKRCSPGWGDDTLACVEEAVLKLKEWRLRDLEDLRSRGLTTLELLQALPRPRLGLMSSARLGELERKFPGHTIRAPWGERFGWVGAPIPGHAFERMSDSAWLRAMKRYKGEFDARRHMRPIRLSGGSLELSREFEQEVKKAPERFLPFALEKMDTSLHIHYLTAAISGLAEAGVPIESLGRVVDRFLPALGQHSVRDVAWAIRKYAETGVPQALEELLEGWVFDRAELDPPGSDTDPTQERRETSLHGYSLGINTDRGAALETVAAILLHSDPPRLREFLALVPAVAEDPSPAVRAVALYHLPACLRTDVRLVARLLRLLVGADRDLLMEGAVAQCVRLTVGARSTELLWVVDALLEMETGANDRAREVGATLSCLAGLCFPERPELIGRCLAGDGIMRGAAAAVFARNVNHTEVGATCRSHLPTLWNDPEAKVREAASLLFEYLEASDMISLAGALRSWAASGSVSEGSVPAARLLEQYPTMNIGLTLDMSGAILKTVGGTGADIQHALGAVSFHLVPAILNAYREAPKKELRDRAIDLLEQAEALGWSDVARAYESADRV